jgi:hypothetical protein
MFNLTDPPLAILTKVVQLDYMYLVKLTIMVKLISQKIRVSFKPLASSQNVCVH